MSDALYVHVVCLQQPDGTTQTAVYNHGNHAKAVTARNKLQHSKVKFTGSILLVNGVHRVLETDEDGEVI